MVNAYTTFIAILYGEKMNYLQIILFVISSSSDNFIVGLSYGMQKIKINFFNNFIIALISGIGTLIAMLSGSLLTKYIPAQFCKVIGSLILIILALYFIANSFKKKDLKVDVDKGRINNVKYYDDILEKPELVDVNDSKSIELGESFILGIALSLNNIGIGIGASILGMNPFITSGLSFVFSMVFIQIGRSLGEVCFSKYFSKTAQIISGLIILLLGIYGLFV
jgi:putative sporulation protein YtaF